MTASDVTEAYQAQIQHTKDFGIKNLRAGRPSEILLVWAFSCILKGKVGCKRGAELRVEEKIRFSRSFSLLTQADWLGLQDHLVGILD